MDSVVIPDSSKIKDFNAFHHNDVVNASTFDLKTVSNDDVASPFSVDFAEASTEIYVGTGVAADREARPFQHCTPHKLRHNHNITSERSPIRRMSAPVRRMSAKMVEWRSKIYDMVGSQRAQQDEVATMLQQKQQILLNYTKYLLEEWTTKNENKKQEFKAEEIFSLQKWKTVFLGSGNGDANTMNDDSDHDSATSDEMSDDLYTDMSSDCRSIFSDNADNLDDSKQTDQSTTFLIDNGTKNAFEEKQAPPRRNDDEDSFLKSLTELIDDMKSESEEMKAISCDESKDVPKEIRSSLNVDLSVDTLDESFLAINAALYDTAKMLDAALHEITTNYDSSMS